MCDAISRTEDVIMSKKLTFIVAILLSLSIAATSTSVEEEQQHQQKSGGVTIEEHKSSVIVDAAAAAAIDTNQPQEDNGEETILIKTKTSSSSSAAQYEPPSHFHISAHIQTNLHTGLSYFLPLDSLQEKSFAHLPFLECGAIGSTTATVPLVSGVFRHVPMMSGVNDKEKMKRGGLEFLEETIIMGGGGSREDEGNEGDDNHYLKDSFFVDTNDDGEDISGSTGHKQKDNNWPKRPSPPTYVVALSPLEITVGGNGNETQQFDAGDVIFFEDTWLGIWDEMINSGDDKTKEFEGDDETLLLGYIMRASPESRKDMNVIMLTIPPALHRQWKHRHQRRQQQQQKKQEAEMSSMSNHDKSTRNNQNTAPWWKLSSRIIKKQIDVLPEPCSLESDPAFAHPSVSVPTTISHHFSQHFTKLLRQFHQPLSSSTTTTSHSDYDLILPIIAQTAAATVGAATAFAGVLHLLRTVNPTVAISFGAACVIGFGTWGIVWLGEELLDEWEMWRERRRLERRMSESWGGALSA